METIGQKLIKFSHSRPPEWKNLKYVAETLNLLQNMTKAENPKYPATQVIQMNMEIALVCAQLCVMAGARAADNHDLVNIVIAITFIMIIRIIIMIQEPMPAILCCLSQN